MFGLYCAQSNREQTRSFPEQKIAEKATVGIEELRCTGGDGETTTPGRKRQGEVVTRGPTD
jgi:hypothetical protein